MILDYLISLKEKNYLGPRKLEQETLTLSELFFFSYCARSVHLTSFYCLCRPASIRFLVCVLCDRKYCPNHIFHNVKKFNNLEKI